MIIDDLLDLKLPDLDLSFLAETDKEREAGEQIKRDLAEFDRQCEPFDRQMELEWQAMMKAGGDLPDL